VLPPRPCGPRPNLTSLIVLTPVVIAETRKYLG
jgi:hypothetical protein